MLFTRIINTCLFISLLFFETVQNNAVVETDTDALAYLERYGYASPKCGNTLAICMSQRLSFKSILRDFQRQFKLPITGKLDARTKKLMNQPRCGVRDRQSSSLRVTRSLADRKWDKRELTWSFRGNDRTYSDWIKQSFEKWREIIPQFCFREVCSTCDADIFLSFQPPVHNHEKNVQDDGFHSGMLAHAYPPKDGTTHFNNKEKWTHSFENVDNTYNFYLVAVHEIGHALGYSYEGEPHNVDDQSSVMYPTYLNLGKDHLFTERDTEEMQNLYDDLNNGDKYSCRMSKVGKQYGGTGGGQFTDIAYACDVCYPIQIEVTYGGGIDYIEMTYTSESSGRSAEVKAPRHGTYSPNLRRGSFRVSDGDRINKIFLTYGNVDFAHPNVIIVTGVQFHTIKGKSSEFFGSKSRMISIEEYPGYYLHYISGRSGAHLDQLQFHWRNII